MSVKSVLLAVLILAGCGSTPKPVDPPRLRAALEAESDGAKRYARGDYAVAGRRFELAIRLFVGIDDASGSARNRMHLARTRLAQGQAAAALELLGTAPAPADPGMALDALLLTAQVQLALADGGAARHALDQAAERCAGTCPQAAGLHLLQARAALAGKRAQEALVHADAALKLLRDKDEAAETGNAWRLIAAARLAAGDAGGALPAAQAALDIDRRLALPEKIARDWMLIGDIHRSAGSDEMAVAYRKALDISSAAALNWISMEATQALNAIGMQKKPSK